MFGWSEKKKPKYNLNRRRDGARGQLLQVSARGGGKPGERTHRAGAILMLLIALVALGFGFVYGMEALGSLFFSKNPRFTIKQIDVRSTGRLQPENLREYARVSEGQNLFALNLAQVRANLEGVPLIRHAEVKRDLPDKLVIRVTERSALARMADGANGFAMLVDRDGYVLGPARLSSFPLITGITDRGLGPGSIVTEKAALNALAIIELCETTRLGSVIHLESVNVRDPDRLILTLEDGEQIAFGRDQFKERLEKLVEVYKTAQDMGKTLVSADLTVLRNVPVVYKNP